MLATRDTIAYRTGTYRTATPEQTWRKVQPMLPMFEISRVADITLLDEIGLPVHVAYRPVGSTLAVSVGTGLTAAQSRVSAVMESIELWHAENPRLPVTARCTAEALSLPYDVRSLALAERSPVTGRVVLDWVTGYGLLTGTPYPVPLDTVLVDFTRGTTWATALFLPSTNGLASGASREDATLHAISEIIERDCLADADPVPVAARRYIDPSSATHPDTMAVYRALRAAGCQVETWDITNALGLPCFVARIWSADLPVTCGGFGCHVDPDIALARAMAEAAQSRLVMVSGARDDVAAEAYPSRRPEQCPLHTGGAPVPAYGGWAGDGITEVIRYCATRIVEATGVEPFVVDLTREDIGIAVSKVFAPGLKMRYEMPRGTGGDRG